MPLDSMPMNIRLSTGIQTMWPSLKMKPLKFCLSQFCLGLTGLYKLVLPSQGVPGVPGANSCNATSASPDMWKTSEEIGAGMFPSGDGGHSRPSKYSNSTTVDNWKRTVAAPATIETLSESNATSPVTCPETPRLSNIASTVTSSDSHLRRMSWASDGEMFTLHRKRFGEAFALRLRTALGF